MRGTSSNTHLPNASQTACCSLWLVLLVEQFCPSIMAIVVSIVRLSQLGFLLV
jgi:hypothetical protein